MNLKELSKTLGLSQTTVSRAFNGYPEVNEQTRRRVIEAAELHNYRPNFRAKGLATGRSFSIGQIVPLSARTDIVNPIFADFMASTGEAISGRGYYLTLSVVKDEDQEKTYRDMAAKGTIDGVIVHGLRKNDPRIGWLRSIGLPFVVHGRGGNQPADYCWVDMNNRRAFRQAAEFLIKLGHNRIALINGDEAMDFAARRRVGYEQALTSHGITPDPSLMSSTDMIESHGYTHASEMTRNPNPPTAYLTSSLLLAIGVRRALHENGLQLGRDVSVVTHDDDLSFLPNSGDTPMFTATRSSIRMAGKCCANMLLDLIEGKIVEPQHVLYEAQLIVGASTAPPPPWCRPGDQR